MNPAPSRAWDIVAGSIYDLRLVPNCGPGFDCTRLTNLRCIGTAHAFDRITLPEDAHETDTWFYLARPSARFTSWGEGNQGPGFPPLMRYFFTPSTSPGMDACDVIP